MRTGAVIGFRHLNPEVANLGQGFEIVVPAEREERRATDAAKAALAVIDELEGESKPRQRGFFVWLHLTDPHAPYEPPDNHPPRKPTHDTRTPINAALRAAPGFQRHNPWFAAAFKRFRFVEPLVARYIAEVEAADEGLGVLVAGLAERGHSKDTAVVVTADHGENLGEHGLYFNHGGLYRSAVHVPLIVSHKSLKPGRFDALTATVDIAPTILSLVGAPRWEPMRGRDLVRVANGLDPGSTFVYSEHTSAQLFAVRSKTATMIWHRKNSRQFPTYPFVAGRRELYDQSVDPGERAPKNHDAELALELDQARQRYLDVGLLLTARQAVVQDRASLRRLGYIE
jgi:arylsulfatase A-like enzyme